MGTPYAKKPLYRSKKCKAVCLTVVPITVIITIILTVFPILKAIATHGKLSSLVL